MPGFESDKLSAVSEASVRTFVVTESSMVDKSTLELISVAFVGCTD